MPTRLSCIWTRTIRDPRSTCKAPVRPRCGSALARPVASGGRVPCQSRSGSKAPGIGVIWVSRAAIRRSCCSACLGRPSSGVRRSFFGILRSCRHMSALAQHAVLKLLDLVNANQAKLHMDKDYARPLKHLQSPSAPPVRLCRVASGGRILCQSRAGNKAPGIGIIWVSYSKQLLQCMPAASFQWGSEALLRRLVQMVP